MKQIKINTNTKKYKIIFGSNIIKNISKILKKEKLNFSKCLVLFDNKIPKSKLNILKSSLKTKKKFYFSFNANEKNKSSKSLDKIHDYLFIRNFNRNDCIISFGGGITGDVGGYAASTYKRGIKFINIPSTLLAQVDSAIGGKTGINNKFGKNLIGSFYQPDLVISDIDLLKTLPKREIICGYAEILKSSLIDGKHKFDFLDKNLVQILNLNTNKIIKAVINSCNLKKKIVEKDEKEKNLRKVLNLGHTFAHAYEASLQYSKKLNHGEAVILGIRNAIKYSNNIKLLSDKNYKRINDHLNKIIMKNNFLSLFKKKDVNKIVKYMKSDKKNISSKINLILIKNFGNILTDIYIKSEKIEKFLYSEFK